MGKWEGICKTFYDKGNFLEASANEEDRKNLNKLIDSLIPDDWDVLENLNGNTQYVLDFFFALSNSIWSYLESELSIPYVMITRWANALSDNIKFTDYQPAKYKPRLPRYYLGYIPFFPWNYGSQFRRAITMAKEGTLIHKASKNSEYDDSKVTEILKKSWNSEGVFYNAACFYAIIASKSTNPSTKKDREVNAIENLKTAIHDPRSGFDVE
ncbi:MAG TPA: hypothetical protein VLA72_03715 [Anaerolineales bacterium]|nr:hypothetical protein [Anaerolineales bacterium]